MTMNRDNYKRLGDYIRLVDVRNRDLAVTNLLGVSISKTFIPSIANTIGTDMSTYKIVEPYQFAYGPVTSRNGDKITFALYKGKEKCIISSAYVTFEIIDQEELNPDYLMMWALRPEFDRYARFMSNGSAREIFSWEEMCDVYLPVPDIHEQRRIVAEYQTIESRIASNEKLVNKLKEAARTIYKKMFVDGINAEDLPDGWHFGDITEIASLKVGGDKPAIFSEKRTSDLSVPVYANGTEDDGIFGYTNKATITERSITITARGTIGCCFLRKTPFVPIVRLVVVQPKISFYEHYLFHYYSFANIQGDGSVQSQLTVPQLIMEKVLVPPKDIVKEFHDQIEPIDTYIDLLRAENKGMLEVQRLLLSKMS